MKAHRRFVRDAHGRFASKGGASAKSTKARKSLLGLTLMRARKQKNKSFRGKGAPRAKQEVLGSRVSNLASAVASRGVKRKRGRR